MNFDFLLNQLRQRISSKQVVKNAADKRRRRRSSSRLTNFESLESRQLLAAVVVEGSLLSGDNIELTADAISLTVTGASSGNGTYALANISSLSIDAKAFNDKVTIKNSFTLPATSNISIIAEEIYVDPGVSITGGDITLRSIGDEHGLSVASNLPLLDIGDIFTGDRKIQIGAGASLTGKDITIEAERISSLLRIKTPFGFGKKDVNIVIDQATITGDSVTINAEAKDENLLDEVPSEAKNWLQNYGGSQILEYVSSGILPTIPYAVMVRSGEANISLASSTIISAGYSQATSTATTTLSGTTTITAGGDVLVSSNADTIADVTASTEINSADDDEGHKTSSANTNALGASLAIAKSTTTSTTLLGSGVEIVATGNVNVRALGNVTNKATSGIEIFVDGRGGLGLALGFDEANINATVNGKITAGGSSTSKELIVPANTVNTDRTTIPNHGFTTGDELLYLAEDPTNPGTKLSTIGNLVDGETVRVIVVNSNEIQLVRELGLPIDGAIVAPTANHIFRAAGSATFNAATAVAGGKLTINSLSLEQGAAITYAIGDTDPAKAGVNAIGALSDQGKYVAINVVKDVGAGTTSFDLATMTAPATPLTLTAG